MPSKSCYTAMSSNGELRQSTVRCNKTRLDFPLAVKAFFKLDIFNGLAGKTSGEGEYFFDRASKILRRDIWINMPIIQETISVTQGNSKREL